MVHRQPLAQESDWIRFSAVIFMFDIHHWLFSYLLAVILCSIYQMKFSSKLPDSTAFIFYLVRNQTWKTIVISQVLRRLWLCKLENCMERLVFCWVPACVQNCCIAKDSLFKSLSWLHIGLITTLLSFFIIYIIYQRSLYNLPGKKICKSQNFYHKNKNERDLNVTAGTDTENLCFETPCFQH